MGRDVRGSVLAVLVVFASAGFVMGQALARVPAVRDHLGADTGALGLALMGMGLGSLLAMPFTGWLVDRFGSGRVVTVAVILGCLGWAAVTAVPSVPVLLAVLVLTGTNVGIWDVAMNIQGTHVEQARSRSLMPFFHAAFSGGAVLGAGSGALAAWLGIGLAQLPVLAAVAAVAGVWGASRFVPEATTGDVGVAEEADADTGTGAVTEPTLGAAEAAVATAQAGPARRGVTPAELLIGLICLAGALAEGSANDWLALLLVDVHGAPAAFGALTLTAFNLTMMIGRLLGGPAIERFGRAAVVRAGGMLAAVAILVVTLSSSLALALAGGLLWGLGVATIFPAAISAAGEVPGRGNRAITVVSTIAYGAFLFGAPTIGLLAEEIGLDRALFLVVGFLALLLVLSPVMREKSGGRDRAGAAMVG
ncbi:MFS transporter [uncultured Serinicoccus sp.]|uniref:MFS transporter n=1 Tax=uncultured Serinicoccus sp. TaxID=735514 RepID=UPI0026181350|nr:MFS transporter [uncultured Serinicoccus sp.]